MTYTARQANPADVAKVVCEASEQTRADMAAADLLPVDVICRYAPLARDPESRTILRGDAPIAVFGWIRIGAVRYCWFVATQEYFSGAVGPQRLSRRLMRAAAERQPHADFRVRLLVDGDKQRRWLEMLGFKQDLGGPNSFIYARRNPAVATPDVAAPVS